MLLHRKPLPHQAPQPLQPPVSLLINALLNLEINDGGVIVFYPNENPIRNVQTLIDILDEATEQYSAAEFDSMGEPLLTLLRRLYEFAPDDVQQSMQYLLLPSSAERMRPLGKSDTLASRLLRLSSSAQTLRIQGSISSFFFELSEKHAAKFVQNVGYGYASGFLATHKIPIPTETVGISPQEQTHDAGAANLSGSGATQRGRGINFVTGQFTDQEAQQDNLPMSEDEQLREAEKLFVLFERYVNSPITLGDFVLTCILSRLKKTGIIDIQNPVQAAVESGCFQELE